mmetsp:Transcript_25699/g.82763  ORF Transcript_25699/g.82763 Transcript_25699/m.82763 type:complete len:360 (+) Transcript_25699:351-1430(+)
MGTAGSAGDAALSRGKRAGSASSVRAGRESSSTVSSCAGGWSRSLSRAAAASPAVRLSRHAAAGRSTVLTAEPATGPATASAGAAAVARVGAVAVIAGPVVAAAWTAAAAAAVAHATGHCGGPCGSSRPGGLLQLPPAVHSSLSRTQRAQGIASLRSHLVLARLHWSQARRTGFASPSHCNPSRVQRWHGRWSVQAVRAFWQFLQARSVSRRPLGRVAAVPRSSHAGAGPDVSCWSLAAPASGERACSGSLVAASSRCETSWRWSSVTCPPPSLTCTTKVSSSVSSKIRVLACTSSSLQPEMVSEAIMEARTPSTSGPRTVRTVASGRVLFSARTSKPEVRLPTEMVSLSLLPAALASS